MTNQWEDSKNVRGAAACAAKAIFQRKVLKNHNCNNSLELRELQALFKI